MPKSTGEIEVFVPKEDFKKVILDVEKYPDFLDEVKEVEVISPIEKGLVAKFRVEVAFAGTEVKTEYTLAYRVDGDLVEWSLEGSPDLTENRGSWTLSEGDDEDETRAEYEAELVTSLPIPPNIQAMFAEQALPEMLEKFRDRAEELF
ncbi:MAG: hypothetical protein KC561_03850 [Myxococcales bacterium]|nr:hypothetical protein [Myxococcales bacterium]